MYLNQLKKSYGRNSVFKMKPYEYEKPYAILDNKKLSLIEDKETYIFEETNMSIKKTDMDKSINSKQYWQDNRSVCRQQYSSIYAINANS